MVEKISRTSRRGLIISAGIMTWNFYIYGSAEDSGIKREMDGLYDFYDFSWLPEVNDNIRQGLLKRIWNKIDKR